MSNIINFSSARKTYRDRALAYKFIYTKPGIIVNNLGQSVNAVVDTGVEVTLIPDEGMEQHGKKRLDKAMIEKFNNLNGGERTMFRMESPL